MARNQTVNRPVSNMFALSRLRKDCYYEPIRVDFSPIQKPNHQFQAIIPQWNKDGHYFTPCFILPKQKISYEQNLPNEKNKFEARVNHAQKQIQEKTPQYKPTDNNYCQLCQEEFDDYWEHINGKYHKRMINTSKFNKDIMALCDSMEKPTGNMSQPKNKPLDKKKIITKNTLQSKQQKDQSKSKCHCLAKTKQSLQTMEDEPSIKPGTSSQERRILQESLKITLQFSTNMVSNNIFKQLAKQS